jgi:hypothetical protein
VEAWLRIDRLHRIPASEHTVEEGTLVGVTLF